MYPRTNYEMTEEDLERILEACKFTPVMMIGSYRAWAALGIKMGFDSSTVLPAPGGNRFFTAIPSEPEDHRIERLAYEAGKKRVAEMHKLAAEIAEKQKQLDKLNVEQTEVAKWK